MTINWDKFELIVKIQRFFGLSYYGFYKSEKNILYVFLFIYQMVIFGLMLNFCSPCLINDFNCLHLKNDSFGIQKFQQIIIHLIIKDFIAITSSLVYSFKGLHLKKTVNGLRKLLTEINNNKNESKLFRSLYWQILLFYFLVLLGIIGYIINLHKVYKKGLIPAILISIAECYTGVLYTSTDFYVVYFTTYLVIIQKSFVNHLKNFINSPPSLRDIIWIKSKFDDIQVLIDRITAFLSPILFFVCCSILYDSVTCLYTTITSLQKSYFFGTKYIAGNFGTFGFFIRLLIICLSTERVIYQVIIRNF